MLKNIILGLGFSSTLVAMPPIDVTSDTVLFETFDDVGLTPGILTDHQGKIIVITYFTPW